MSACDVEHLHADPRWKAWKRSIDRAVKALNDTHHDIVAAGYTDANWYLAMECLNLMLGESHSEDRGETTAHHENSAHRAFVWRSSGGDW